MKKTFKTALALILALILACGPVAAFAQAPESINWKFYDPEDIWVYTYGGSVTADGKDNAVKADESNCLYYTVEIPKSGFYKMDTSRNSAVWYGFPEKIENGEFYGTKQGISDYSDDGFYSIYYLDAGTNFFGVDFDSSSTDYVSFEYLGEIENFEINSDISTLVADYNIWRGDGDGLYHIESCDGIKIKFSDGFEYSSDYATLDAVTDEDLFAGGEFELEVGFYAFDYTVTVTVNILNVRDIIEKIELSNAELYGEVIRCYNGTEYYYPVTDETLKVTYTDGTTEKIYPFYGDAFLSKYDYLWVSSGIEYNAEEDKEQFIVYTGGENFVEIDCYYRDATVAENIAEYRSENSISINTALNNIYWYVSDIFNAPTVDDMLSAVKALFSDGTSDILLSFSAIIENTAAFISYMF